MPPAALFEALIDRSEPAGGHWYWEGDFNREREAVQRWVYAPGKVATLVVARALIELRDNAPLPPRRRLYNTCGVVACVRPDHWTLEEADVAAERRRLVVVADFDGKGYRETRRRERCRICGAPPEGACVPKPHDTYYRTYGDRDSRLACAVCAAPPGVPCDWNSHAVQGKAF